MVECSFNSVEKCLFTLFTYVRLLHKELSQQAENSYEEIKVETVKEAVLKTAKLSDHYGGRDSDSEKDATIGDVDNRLPSND
ncbi:hypothetical protein THAOC_27153 [Thalassiosira oceanica]|uniref:Uncharacterized protein n=1 Tax=Thalassiosira oceanica TaxID=159749 RepID=K0RJM0_THAOC|nr:hypothetical protein THAOC_27153 [Thalassiosira oceanica]|eukprot:EJK53420.1 hypothetical protein THAOC_27153 [Thalassiosira oceanica]